MCYKWEEEYLLQRAEEVRKAIEKDAERAKPKPAAPATPALEPSVRTTSGSGLTAKGSKKPRSGGALFGTDPGSRGWVCPQFSSVRQLAGHRAMRRLARAVHAQHAARRPRRAAAYDPPERPR
jgi:hypothetical protein